jgi:hypothetical protein
VRADGYFEHLRDPMKAGNVIRPQEIIALGQFDFEHDFGRCLLDLGYRIRPHCSRWGIQHRFGS